MSGIVDRAARAASCPWRVRFDGRYWWIEARDNEWRFRRQTREGCRYAYLVMRDEWLRERGLLSIACRNAAEISG